MDERPKCKTGYYNTKLLEETNGGTLFDINHISIFLDLSPRVTRNKSKTKQMGPNLTQNLLHSKRNCQKMKSQPTEWKKIFGNDISN